MATLRSRLSAILILLAPIGSIADAGPAAAPVRLPFSASGVMGPLDTSSGGPHTVVFDTSSGLYAVDGVTRNDERHRVALQPPHGQQMWAFDFSSIRLAADTKVVVRGSNSLVLLSRGPALFAAPLDLEGSPGAPGGRGAGGGGGGGGGAVAILAGGTLTLTGSISVRGGAGGPGNLPERAGGVYVGGAGGGGAVLLGSADHVVLDGGVYTASGDATSSGPLSVVGPVRYGPDAVRPADVRELPSLSRDAFVLFGGAGGGGGGGSGLPISGPAGYARIGGAGGIPGPGGGAGGAAGYAVAGGSGGNGGRAASNSNAGGGGGGGGGAYAGPQGNGGLGNGSGAGGGPGGAGGAGECSLLGNDSADGGSGGSGGSGSGSGGAGGRGGNGGSTTLKNGWNGSNGSATGGGGGGGGGGADSCSGVAPGSGGAGGAGSSGGSAGGSGGSGSNRPTIVQSLAAQAVAGGPTGRGCGFLSVTDWTVEGDVQTGEVDGGPLLTAGADNPGEETANISIRCTIQVGAQGATHAGIEAYSAEGPTNPGVAVLPAHQFSYVAPAGSPVYLCTEAEVNGQIRYFNETEDNATRGWSTSSASACALAISQEIDL